MLRPSPNHRTLWLHNDDDDDGDGDDDDDDRYTLIHFSSHDILVKVSFMKKLC